MSLTTSFVCFKWTRYKSNAMPYRPADMIVKKLVSDRVACMIEHKINSCEERGEGGKWIVPQDRE